MCINIWTDDITWKFQLLDIFNTFSKPKQPAKEYRNINFQARLFEALETKIIAQNKNRIQIRRE